MRILVVEDEAPLREVFGEYLRGLGHRTLTAHSAEAALETIEAEPPDAVLLDIYLPGMSGLDFLRLPATRAAGMPVVAISGIATEAQARECLRLGAVDFVGKPVVLERLGEVFAALERRGRAPQPPSEPADRRRGQRVLISLPVRVRDDEGVEWEGTTVDVSAVGVRILPNGPARSGSLVHLSLELPDGNGPFTIWAVRVRHDYQTYMYDFLEATEAQRARLRGLVTRFTQGAADVPDPHVRILHTITQATGTGVPVDTVLDTALDALTHVSGHEMSSVHLVSPDGKTLRLDGERGMSPEVREASRVVPFGEGPIGRVAVSGATVQESSTLCVAIHGRGRVLGVLAVGRRAPETFSPNEIELVEAAAKHIGLALDNATLHEEARRQADRLKRTEAQLLETERLATLGQLAAGVAHEINNPLTAVLGHAELLLIRNAVVPDAVDRVRTIVQETARAVRLLGDMLQLARPRRPERRQCVLADEVGLVLTLKSPDLHRAGIEVITSFEPIAPVWADEDQIRQVLLNLVQNAAHAMTGRAGRRVLTVRVLDVAGRARVEVLDTGPGISANVLPRILDPFFTTKPVGEGTGLGLWVSASIAEQHGGRLRVENREPHGAAFIFEIPYSRRSS